MRIILIALCLISLASCSMMTERTGGHDRADYAQYKAEIRDKAAACQASEQDLLPQSVKAIVQGDTEYIIDIYLSIYNSPKLPRNMQAESLYQIGLIHMNEYNEHRNDDQAIVYFNRLKTEYSESALCARVDEHLKVIEHRNQYQQDLDPDTLIAMREAIEARAKACVAEESALLIQSIEAISHKQAHKVIQGFLDMVNNPRLSQDTREQALYQVGLIYMNTANVHRDDRLALHYFNQLLIQFPDSKLCHNAREHVEVLENRIEQ